MQSARCVQCQKIITGTAYTAQVVHRPVTVKGCLHGPFCARCKRSVARQVLPFCVCRALVDNWQETTVPTVPMDRRPGPEKPKVPVVAPSYPARRSTDAAVRVAAGGAPNPALASANFVSWESFTVKSGQAATNGHDSKLHHNSVTSEKEAALRRSNGNLVSNGGSKDAVARPAAPRTIPKPEPGGKPVASAMQFAADAASLKKRRRA
mmetsp:Transcript_72396/g.159928  ORF Transcript_72396/g.159928 Transcript_72396/m.159928 type:complete len:208 (-) Transcript_72396:44-667(-)